MKGRTRVYSYAQYFRLIPLGFNEHSAASSKASLPPAIHRFSQSNEMKHNQLNCARSRARGWRDQLSRKRRGRKKKEEENEKKIPFDSSWRRSVERAPRQSRQRERTGVSVCKSNRQKALPIRRSISSATLAAVQIRLDRSFSFSRSEPVVLRPSKSCQ